MYVLHVLLQGELGLESAAAQVAPVGIFREVYGILVFLHGVFVEEQFSADVARDGLFFVRPHVAFQFFRISVRLPTYFTRSLLGFSEIKYYFNFY